MPHTQTSVGLERKYAVSFLDRQLVEFGKAAGTLERFADPFYYFYNDDDFKGFQEIIRGPSVRLLLILSVEWIKSNREKESSEQDLRIWYRYGQPDSMTLTFYANSRHRYPKGYVEVAANLFRNIDPSTISSSNSTLTLEHLEGTKSPEPRDLKIEFSTAADRQRFIDLWCKPGEPEEAAQRGLRPLDILSLN
ncbi:hypothetical protein MMC30_001837 [Trapelia coarctata]|nr:hypothetical protein [Trapelia coarctata]